MDKVKITVVFFKDPNVKLNPFGPVRTEPQEKTFNTRDDCMMWCRKNYKRIFSINNFRTLGEEVSHFDIMSAIDGAER